VLLGDVLLGDVLLGDVGLAINGQCFLQMVSASCKWSVIHTVDELHVLLAETTEGWKVIAAFLARNLVYDHMQTQRVFEQATSTLMKLYEIISRSKSLIPDSIRNGYGMTEFRNFRSTLLTPFCSKRALFYTHYA
jgi:hypothetical protein